MARCQIEGKSCAGTSARVVRVRDRALNACAPCSRVAWLSEYRSQWDKGIAFDRGTPTQGYEWLLDPVPAPWGTDELDPRTEDEKRASRKRRGL